MNDKTLSTIERRLARLEKAVFGQRGKTKDNRKSTASAKTSDFSGATGGVHFLVSRGFFKQKRTLAAARTALSDHEYHYSAPAVQMALNRQSGRKGPLAAFKEGGKKLYVKRK
jgi:hypothetical protein